MSKRYKSKGGKEPYKEDLSKEYMKCAPSKKFEQGTCFTIESLVKMCEAYNGYIKEGLKGGSGKNNKIIIRPIEIKKDNKRHLLQELIDRLSPICGNDQICILNQPFIKQLHDFEISKNTFPPLGPQGKFEWLNTTNIDDVMTQYMTIYPSFIFIGALPLDFDELPFLGVSNLDFDELYQKGKTQIGAIINTDTHDRSGQHWLGLYANLEKSQVYFFDSYGVAPHDLIRKLVERIASWCNKKYNHGKIQEERCKMMTKSGGACKYERIMNIDFNRNRHQYKDSECGVYSIFFILKMLEGNKFDDIVNDKIPDQQMTDLRDNLFRFK
jgi:hypothetical protein